MTFTAARAPLATPETETSGRTDRLAAGRYVRPTLPVVAVAIAMLVGLVLRIAAARGDLWLDELWSLDLVAGIASPDQVFWAISHDNNHFLNSLWMELLGPAADPMAYRVPSIVFGTAAVLVAARIGARSGRAACVVAAILVAVSYVGVDYGSEARGYGGLILAALLSLDLIERMLVGGAGGDPAERPHRWLLGLVMAFGLCAHLTMVVQAVILGLTAGAWTLLCGSGLRRAIDRMIELFRPSLLLALPIVAAIGLGIAVRGQFTLGGRSPFTVAHFVEGYGGLLSVLLGLPASLPPVAGVVAVLALAAVAWRAGLLDRLSTTLGVVALGLVPALLFLARPSNVEFPRYFLVCGLVLPILIARGVGRLWPRHGIARWAGAALVALISIGQVPRLVELLRDHRGAAGTAVALMTADGPTTVSGSRATLFSVDAYGARTGVTATRVDPLDPCRAPATWLVKDSGYGEPLPTTSPADRDACSLTYARVATFPTALWSGRAWTLFKHP